MNTGKFSNNSLSSLRVNTGVSFKMQLGRDQVKVSTQPGAHEARFAYLSEPCKVFSSYHEHKIPGFDKVRPRDNSAIFYSNMTLKDYSPSQPAYLVSLKSGCMLCIYVSY